MWGAILGSVASGLISHFFGGGGGGGGIVSSISSSASLSALVSSVGSAVVSLLNGAGSSLDNVVTAMGNGLSSLFSGGFKSFTNAADSILSEVHNVINDVSGVEADVVKPIATLVHGVSADVQALNDQVIAPIKNLITDYTTTSTSLLDAVHKDLNGSLQGMLKFSQDVSNTLTSADAQFSRAVQEMGSTTASTAKDILVPGLVQGIGGPIGGIVDKLTAPEFAKVDNAAFQIPVDISAEQATGPYLDAVQTVLKEMQDSTGILGLVLKVIYDAALTGDYLMEQVRISTRPVLQKAMSEQTPELLGVAETIEAWRRGILSSQNAEAELLKQGIGIERQAVLYELAQFLFGPREIVEMHQRGIIDDNTFTTLRQQNNMDSGQAAALLEYMEAKLGPADIAAATARGYITAEQALSLYQSALVPSSLTDIIPALEQTLVNPQRMIRMRGRAEAAANGLMSQTLTSAPPKDILDQYDRIQAEAGTAELDYLESWDVPGASWWVDAYFRGLRTRTEVENAFTALRIPPEIWDDIFKVEEELPPVWLVPDIVKTGVWSREQAVPTLMKLGFSEENANVLYDYGYAARKVQPAVTANDLSKVSLGNAKTAFDDGLIDAPTYEQVLLDHKYTLEAAQLTVSLAQYEAQQAALKAQADTLVEEVKLGVISKTQAEDQLYNLGMTTAQVARYLDKIETSKILNAKLPTEANVEKMYKKQIITEQEALATLSLLGYSDTWAARIFALW